MTTSLEQIDRARAWLDTIPFDFDSLDPTSFELQSYRSVGPAEINVHAQEADADVCREMILATGGPAAWEMKDIGSFCTLDRDGSHYYSDDPTVTVFVSAEAGHEIQKWMWDNPTGVAAHA